MNKFERYHPIEVVQTEQKDIIEDISPYHIPDHLFHKKKIDSAKKSEIIIEPEKQIEKSKSKTPKRKLKKVPSKSNTPTMARIQKKLS